MIEPFTLLPWGTSFCRKRSRDIVIFPIIRYNEGNAETPADVPRQGENRMRTNITIDHQEWNDMSNKLSKKNNKKKEPKKRSGMGLVLFTVIAVVLIVGILAFVLLNQPPEEQGAAGDGAEVDLSQVSGPSVTISVKDYGDIKVKLDEEAAPITVDNFVGLVKDGFYDGLTFHRIMDGFMIQGGDPLGNGTGGSDETIKGEFSSNGVDNPISHKRGVISMARSNDPDSASSQFFIVQADSTFLDGDYAGFGYVTEGMEVVDKICEDVEEGENGAVEPEDQPVIESITLDEE